MKSYIQVSTTTETKEQAEKIAQHLVETKLAACVQITGPITSIYRWKGKVENTREWLCLIKTQEKLLTKWKQRLKSFIPMKHRRLSPCQLLKAEGISDLD